MSAIRKIIHLDMDAYFAAIESRDNPQLERFPFVVGRNSQRGVVATANYLARKFGVHSAMSIKKALLLCPDLKIIPPRMDLYRAESQKIMQILRECSSKIEALSLDEAYIDVSENDSPATFIATDLRAKIWQELKLSASAGISYNKALAKLASEQAKPNGQFTIKPNQATDFIHNLAINKFPFVGKKTAQKMYQLGIFSGKDLLNFELVELENHFGKIALFFYNLARGIDNREVNPQRLRKSFASENTFEHDVFSYEILQEFLIKHCEKAWKMMEKQGLSASRIFLTLRFANFQRISRSKTFSQEINNLASASQHLRELLNQIDISSGVRLIGAGFANLQAKTNRQLSLF